MDNIELFKDDGKTVVMPSLDNELKESEQIKSKDITEAILGSTVATVIIQKDMHMELPNYVLDFSEYSEITMFQKESLSNLITTKPLDDGVKTALYLYNGKKMIKFGTGEIYKLEVIIPIIRDKVFDNQIRVYRNVDGISPLDELKTRDNTKVRLRL